MNPTESARSRYRPERSDLAALQWREGILGKDRVQIGQRDLLRRDDLDSNRPLILGEVDHQTVSLLDDPPALIALPARQIKVSGQLPRSSVPILAQ